MRSGVDSLKASDGDGPTVAVVVPAYNAERTIDKTLESVRSQTHRNLDIIVVDDGSTDGTVARVETHVRADPRVRLLRQANAGVAAARNLGIKAATSEFVAPTDADDVWHPEKIQRQLEVFRNKPDVGLVCTLYVLIDENDFLIPGRMPKVQASYEFLDLCRRNFIGNASSALMRRDAVLALNGYDASLRAQGAQGCEDLKLYLRLAEQYGIEIVPLPLTGYRQMPGNMSSNGWQMLKSFDLVADELGGRRPDVVPALQANRVFLLRWLIIRALAGKQWQVAVKLGIELLRGPLWLVIQSALLACSRALSMPKQLLKSKMSPPRQYSELRWD